MNPSTPSKSASHRVHIVGAGMAGSEAAWFLAERGIPVTLHEMRPVQQTPAHQTGNFAELVCSNTFKSTNPVSAPGMLKADMTRMGSILLKLARDFSVPAGEALGVDREKFSEAVTRALKAHPRITFAPGEVTEPFPDGDITLLASGPLTSDPLCEWIAKATGAKDLYFYDAIAPIIDAPSIDMDRAFLANRWDKGEEEAYLNCPMNEEEYNAFIDALTVAEKVTPKSFEKEKFFAGCQPIEAIAATGRESLRFGPMKPVGLTDPRTGRRPWAVVQLRPENRARTAFNLVGFQTKLKYGEQSKVFRMIPALHRAEFLRLGSIHRNTYVCGPRVLRQDLSLKGYPSVYLAGQITGVEGYLESAACGILAAWFIEQRMRGIAHSAPPANTALGALLRHVTGGDAENYQPANAHFGLFDPTHFEGVSGLKKDELRTALSKQADRNFESWWQQEGASLA